MPDFPQTIADFYTSAQQKDFARDNLFRIININFNNNSNTIIGPTDLVYCRTATLPGKTIVNVAAPYMGLQFNVPGVVQFAGSDSYTMSFYCDQASALRDKFLQVVDDTFSVDSSTGNYFIAGPTAVIDMAQLDKQLNVVNQFQLVGVSIRKVGDMAYDISGGTGQVVNFDVTVAYHFWNNTTPQ